MKQDNAARKSPPVAEPYSLTIDGVTQHFGISRSSVYRLLSSGQLTAKKFTGRTMILTADVRALIESAPPAEIRLNAGEAA